MKRLLNHFVVFTFVVLLAACGGGGSGGYGGSGSSSSGGGGSSGSGGSSSSSSGGGGGSSGGGNINFSVWVSNGDNNSVTEITPAAISAGSCTAASCIVFTGGGINGAGQLTVDANGNVWVANSPFDAASGLAPYSVTEITAAAVAAGGCSSASCLNYTGSEIFALEDITSDMNGNIWVTQSCAPTTNFANGPCGVGNGGVTEIKPGAAQDCSSGCAFFSIQPDNTGYPSLFPMGVAVDLQGDVWFTAQGCASASNCATPNSGSVVEITTAAVQEGSCSSGCVLYSNNDAATGNIANPTGIAIDNIGNAWVANECGPANCLDYFGGSVTEIKSGAPSDCSSGCIDYTGGGVFQPSTVAVDDTGNIWVADPSLPGLTEITSAAATAGTCSAPSCVNFNTGNITSDTRVLAIDPDGDIWLTRSTDGTVLEVMPGAPTDCSSGCMRITVPQGADDIAIMP